MSGGSGGYRVAPARRQPTPGLISSSPGTAGLPPSISFSTGYPQLVSSARASMYRFSVLSTTCVLPSAAAHRTRLFPRAESR